MRMFDRLRNREEKKVSKADKMWLQSIMKRQKMVLEDLTRFNELYRGKVDEEVVGSLYSVYEMLRDNSESILYSDADREAYNARYLGLDGLELRADNREPMEYVGLERADLFKSNTTRQNFRY